jgi:hypothetical protein
MKILAFFAAIFGLICLMSGLDSDSSGHAVKAIGGGLNLDILTLIGIGMSWSTGAGTDTSLGEKLLKEWYMPGFIDTQNNLCTTRKVVRRRMTPLKGKYAVVAIRTGRTGGITAIPPSQIGNLAASITSGAPSLPSPGYQPFDNAFIRPKIMMFAVGIPQDTIDVSSGGDRAAFLAHVDAEMQGAKVDSANYEDLTCYKGGNVTLATITAVTGGANVTAVTVSNSYPFYKNKSISFYDASNAFFVTRTVASVNHSTRVVTLSSAAGAILTTFSVVTTGARPATGTAATDLYALEPWGLDVMVSASNPTLKDLNGVARYMGIDRSALPEWQSVELDANGAFTYSLGQQVLDQIHDLSGGDPTVAFTTRATRRGILLKAAYGTTTEAGLTHQRTNDSIKHKVGINGYREDKHGAESDDWLRLNDEIPFVLDRYASHDYANSKGTVFFVDTRHLYEAIVTDWKFWAPQGRILREASNSNSFGLVAHAYKFFDRVLDAPNTCGKLYNISV